MLERPNTDKVKTGDRPSANSHNLITNLANAFSSGQHIQGVADSTGFHQRRSPAPQETRLAYCKDDAGGNNVIDCYLDVDGTGDVVEVNFSIAQLGFGMNAATPLLSNGDIVFVIQDRGLWWCTTVFNPSKECDCYEA